jgi:hypothetical protein
MSRTTCLRPSKRPMRRGAGRSMSRSRGGKIVVPRPYPETASSNRAEMRQLYRSPNGDVWFLARDPATGMAFVRHQANAPSGGQVTELGAFLSGPQNPEREALLRLIGASILNPRGAEVDDEPAAVNAGNEWSDADMKELGDVLLRGLSIARLLRRDHGEVRDKVAQVGRACRASPTNRLRASEISEGPLGGSIGWRGWGAAASIAPGRGPPAPNPSGPLGERAMVGAPSAASDGGGYVRLGPLPG